MFTGTMILIVPTEEVKMHVYEISIESADVNALHEFV